MMGSIYATKDKNFVKDLHVCHSKPDYFQKIHQEIQDELTKPGGGRAVLVFFETEERMSEFTAARSGQGAQIKMHAVTNDKVHRINHYIETATKMGAVTLFPKVFGRGLDFVCESSRVNGNGGVHVIQTFLSQEKSEEAQIQGRTCRQGQKGSYRMILLKDDLIQVQNDVQFIPNECLERVSGAAGGVQEFVQPSYDELDKHRMLFYDQISALRSQTVQKAKKQNDSAIEYQNMLVSNVPSLEHRIEKLKSFNTRLACGGSGSNAGGVYHFIFCFDQSGSMIGEPWMQLLQAFEAFIDARLRVSSWDIVSVIKFDHNSCVEVEAKPITSIKGMQFSCRGGGTHFGPPIIEAEALALKHMITGSPVLIFMSDGDGGSGIQECIHLVQKVPSIEGNANMVYFGSSSVPPVLQQMAIPLNAKCSASVNADALKQAFVAIAEDMAMDMGN
jgi:hypothetical protein